MFALEKIALGDLLRWVVAPDSIGTWIVSTALWASILFAGSLYVGAQLGRPSGGVSAGIFLSGLSLLVLTDQMWRRLEICIQQPKT